MSDRTGKYLVTITSKNGQKTTALVATQKAAQELVDKRKNHPSVESAMWEGPLK